MANQLDKKRFWDREAGRNYFFQRDHDFMRDYLAQHIGNRNLDLGGGSNSESYVPGSAVLDISFEALAKNPAQRKVVFNLDSISLGNKLPFYDREFDSVTMRSVWQYLRFPFDLLKELKRVVLIGSQVFIIGVNDLTCEDTGIAERSSKIREIEREIQQAGYQTKLDWIGKSQRRRRFLRTRLKIGCVRVRL